MTGDNNGVLREKSKWGKLISVSLVLNFIVLSSAYFVPFVSVSKLAFWESHYSLLGGIFSVIKEGNYFVGVILFLFSICFPLAKILILGWVWFVSFSSAERRKLLGYLSKLGKWSMLDVFVVAILVVLSTSTALGDVQPQIGLYLFTLGIVLSMIFTLCVEKEEKKNSGSEST